MSIFEVNIWGRPPSYTKTSDHINQHRIPALSERTKLLIDFIMRTSFAVFALLSAIPAFAAAYPASSSYGSGPADTPSTPTYGSGSSSASGDAPVRTFLTT